VATAGVIKSITGRHFQMAPGRLLASNQGGELLFGTGLCSISVEPQATAIVEVSIGPNATKTVKIYALDARGGRSVDVAVPTAKEKSFKLYKGEVLVIGDHQLTDSDFAGIQLSNKSRVEDKITKGNFPVAQFVDQDLMLKSEAQSSERYSALSDLKRRITEVSP
jgi:hypothetical protein